MDQAPRATTARLFSSGQLSQLWLGWLVVVLAIAGMWAPELVSHFRQLANPPAEADEALRAAYISASAHAGYHVSLDVFFGLGCLAVAALILRRHSRDTLAVSAAFVLTVWGICNGIVVESMGTGHWWAVAASMVGWGLWVWLMVRCFQVQRTEAALAVRQRVRWLWYGAATSFVLILVFVFSIGSGITLSADQIDRHMTGHLVLVLSAALFPISLSVAWLFPTVPDPDTLIRRTLVYGALTSIVIAGAIAFVLVPAYFYYEAGPLYLLCVVTAWAVGGIQLSQWVQRSVNRMLYGQRDEPMTILSDLGSRLELGSPETVLSTIVDTVAATLKLPAVAIRAAEDEQDLASVGQFNLEAVFVPIMHQGELVGRLVASTRARDEPLHERDHGILRLVARQAGPTVRAVQLNQELRRSRQQILSGREEERRRIRRDLHDGLGPALAAIAMQADTARAVVDDDPAAARQLLIAVTKQAEDVVHEVRRLVYDLRPPALDELGLVGAIARLGRQTSSVNLSIEVAGPDSLPPLNAALEVAIYRIVAEALTNVARHSRATNCSIRVAVSAEPAHQLSVTIDDNGVGITDDSLRGIGLRSMHDRASEVGGTIVVERGPESGTRVEVTVPLESHP